MKIRNYLSVVLVILSISGCFQPTKNYIVRVKLLQLKENDIYDKNIVYDVIFDAQELQVDSLKNTSRQQFLQGLDLYKNKNKPNEAIELFKKSILTFPDAKAYYELGNALLDSRRDEGKYKEAIKAYKIAEHLNFQPKSMIFFKRACVYNALNYDDPGNDYDVYNNICEAFRNGFSDTNAINNEPYLVSFVKTERYKNMLLSIAVEKIKDSKQSLFDLYLKSFPLLQQPFEIDAEDVTMKDYQQSISYDFAKFIPEMQNSSFGRDVSNDYFFVARIVESPQYIAVLYSSINFYGEQLQPVYTKLVTYDIQGNIISGKLFSGQLSAEKIKTGRIENNELILKDYKRVWKMPFDKVDFELNSVERYELVATATFLIDDSGKIMEKSVPSNYNDSSIVAKN